LLGGDAAITGIDINSGTIDGAVIGGNSAAAISGTTLALSGNFASNAASTISTADNTTQLTLISTDADASVGPVLDLYRNSASPADSDVVGRINFQGENSAGEIIDYAYLTGIILDVTDGTEDGYIAIRSMLAGADIPRITMDGTETVINDASKDLDTRVESDNATHALFVQGSDGKVGINTSAPAHKLDVDGEIRIKTNTNGLIMQNSSSADVSILRVTGGNNVVLRDSTNSDALILDSSGNFKVATGNLVVGTAGKGIDFSAQTQSGSTTTSELLDHYEEGTWSPAVTDIGGNDATMGSVRGKYIRIGTLVIANYGFNITSKGSMTGNFVFVKGIPFNHSGSNAGTGTLNRFSGLSGAVSGLSMEIGGNITNVAWFTDLPGTGATADGYLSPSQISNSFFAQGTLIYSIV